MILDESLYDPLIPEDKQGVGAWNRIVATYPEKRPNLANSIVQRPRKLRRIASAKLGSQNEGIWPDIVGKGIKISAEAEMKNHQQIVDIPSIANPRHALQEVKSFASETTLTEALDTVTQKIPQPLSQNGDVHRRSLWSGSCFYISGFSSSEVRIQRCGLFVLG
jgi:hypothetical protein